MDEKKKKEFIEEIVEEYQEVREEHYDSLKVLFPAIVFQSLFQFVIKL